MVLPLCMAETYPPNTVPIVPFIPCGIEPNNCEQYLIHLPKIRKTGGASYREFRGTVYLFGFLLLAAGTFGGQWLTSYLLEIVDKLSCAQRATEKRENE